MSDPIVEQAYAFLRAHSTADLRFDENMREIKYVIAPDGRLVMPVMVAMLRSVDTVLFVPSYEEGAMELQVTLQEFDEHSSEGGTAADRWRIYHGEPLDVRWAWATIDMARFGEMVIDGEALLRSNPLANDEAALCREMNKDHSDALRLLCTKYGNMEVEQPVMVGIDPNGLDVRARFDIVRVPSSQPMPTAEDARRVLADMSRLT